MNLVKEIQNVHDFMYSEVGDTVKPLVPIILTILDKYKENKKASVPDPIEKLKNDILELDRMEIESTLHKIRREHSNKILDDNPGSLLNNLINDAITTIVNQNRLSDPNLESIKQRISDENFLKGLEKEDDFIGILFETLATHSKVFDKKEGRFFTPKNIIITVVEMVAALMENENVDFKDITVCDPCSGSARYLVNWASTIKREEGIKDEDIIEIYTNQLFGMDISEEVAKWAAWNMIFHGDGAANVANVNSLNYFGILTYWDLIQKFLEEAPQKLDEMENIQQNDIQAPIRDIKNRIGSIMPLKGTMDIDLNSKEVEDLLNIIDELITIQRSINQTIWDTLKKLSNKRGKLSVKEVELKWKNFNPNISKGFDLIITNPPFGRSNKDLQVNNPYILCQYKLATELWIGDLTKTNVEKLLKRLYNKSINEIYKELLDEIGINEIKSEYEVKFSDLDAKLLKKLARQNNITKNQNEEIISELQSNLGRKIVIDGELAIKATNLPANAVKKITSSVLYNSNLSDFLFDKIKSLLGREWVTIEDIMDYEHKVSFKNSITRYEHTIYYNNEWEPLLFKNSLPKQIVFLEEFLRLIKEGGYIYTVIDTGILSNTADEYVRRFLYKNSKIHSIVEFPHGAFKSAGTSIKTAIILYQKLENPSNDYDIFGSLPLNLGYKLNKQDVPLDPDNNDLGKVLCDWRNYLGLGKLDNHFERDCEECNWEENGYCPVWREEIEKLEL